MLRAHAPRSLPLLAALALALVCGAAAGANGEDEYRLGVGDTVRVTVFDQPDLLTEGEITESGKLNMALVGEVAVAGMTRNEAAAVIAASLQGGGFVRDPNVIVRVLEYRSQQVTVLGEVVKPGRYPISRPTSVAELIAAAGGIAAKGSTLVTVTQTSADGQPRRQDVETSELTGNGAANTILLRAGDSIYVPGAPMVYVYGEVKQPGAYPLQPGMTVLQALAVGGGLTPRGTERGIRIERRGADGAVHAYSVRGNEKLEPNDVLRVLESWF